MNLTNDTPIATGFVYGIGYQHNRVGQRHMFPTYFEHEEDAIKYAKHLEKRGETTEIIPVPLVRGDNGEGK